MRDKQQFKNHTSRNFMNLAKLYKVFIPSVVFLISGIIITSASRSVSAVSSAELNLSATVEPSLNVTVPVSTVALNLNPVTENLATQTVPVTVGTNNEAGYTLTMTAASTSLTRDDSDGISATIDTLEPSASGYTTANFMPNRWGYSKNGSNFFPFATSTALASSDTKVNDDTTTLAFAAKADYAKPAGEYSLDLTFTATANPNITYIQNLNPDLCVKDKATTVYDSRDGAEYKVQRLADDKCWLLDNLRLGENTTKRLYPTDTNITAEYYDLPASSTSGFSHNSPSSFTAAAINTDSKDDITTSYGDGSGKIGVYYNYCAASAGTYCYASGSGVGDAVTDICPTGWRMPTSGEYYALCSAAKGSVCTAGDWQDDSSIGALAMRAALATPLSGYFEDIANVQGSYGYFWSSTRYDGTNAYRFVVTSSIVSPQNPGWRNGGFSVRCILK